MAAAYKVQAGLKADMLLDDALTSTHGHLGCSFLCIIYPVEQILSFYVNLVAPVPSSDCLAGKSTARSWTLTPVSPRWTHSPTDDQSARTRTFLCMCTQNMRAHAYTCRCARKCKCVHVHTRMHTRIHTYTYVVGCFVNPEAFDCDCYAKKRRFCG